MTKQPPSPKRRRGGQPGNINALKHGFYTRRFTSSDLDGVASTDFNSLMEEIAIIRLYTRRLIELDQSVEIDQVANILRILCLASLTITRLVKTSHYLTLNAGSSDGELHQALEQLTHFLNLDRADPPPAGVILFPHLPTR